MPISNLYPTYILATRIHLPTPTYTCQVLVLGFAFRGDLVVLEPLCGAGMRVDSLVDLQRLGRTDGESTPSLRRVCARALGLRLDKSMQCSDWGRRPLTRRQFVYAALDAHVLLRVYDALAPAAGTVCEPCQPDKSL